VTTDPLYHPELWPLRRDVAHLNHGSFGAVPLPVLAHQQEWRSRMEANPVGFFRRELQPALDSAREAMCAFLGSDPLGGAFVQNTTSGASSVFASFPLGPGDEVVIADHIYGAVLFALLKTAQRTGARVVEVAVPLAASDDEVVDALIGAVTERTRLLVVDHISSATAKLFPVARIVSEAHALGVAVFVDAAHAPGMLPVDVAALGADFWCGNFHKWACAPRGAAGFYVAPRWRESVGSFPVGWREGEGFPHSFTQPGTADLTGWLSVPAALEFFASFGWSAVRARNCALVEYGQRVVAEAVGAGADADLGTVPGKGTGGDGLSMRLVPLAQVPAQVEAADALRDRIADEAGIETTINVWGGRALLRLSAQLYNSEDEYERLAVVLRDLLD
jgi:isopenicillin-N epimerase